jgi:hypothetical protein
VSGADDGHVVLFGKGHRSFFILVTRCNLQESYRVEWLTADLISEETLS